MDGYVDRVYIGDMIGQMWVFDVSFNNTTKKSNSYWAGDVLFKAPTVTPEKHPIYGTAAVALDDNRKPWVFFGTGDREDPKNVLGPQERFYAVRDDGVGTYPLIEDDLVEKDLSNVTNNNTFTPDPTKRGWFLKLEAGGQVREKVWEKAIVFNGLVYFTSYVADGSVDPCGIAGSSRLYIVEYKSGGGAFNVQSMADFQGTPSDRFVQIGTGTPSAPVITLNLKGEATVTTGMMSGKVHTRKIFAPKNKSALYWRDVVK